MENKNCSCQNGWRYCPGCRCLIREVRVGEKEEEEKEEVDSGTDTENYQATHCRTCENNHEREISYLLSVSE